MDVILRNALTRNGEPQPNAADEDGAVLVQSRHDKQNTNPELVASERCRLVVLTVRNRRSVERRGCQHPPSARSCPRPGGPRLYQPPSCIGVGTSLDPHARIHVRSCVRNIVGGTFLTGGEAPGLCDLLTLDPDVSCCDPAFSLCFEKCANRNRSPSTMARTGTFFLFACVETPHSQNPKINWKENSRVRISRNAFTVAALDL